MNILYRRPLCIILSIVLGSFVLFTVFDELLPRIILLSLATLIFCLTFIGILKPILPPLFIRLACIAVIVASAFSYLYFDVWYKAYNRFTDESEIVGNILQIEHNSYSNIIHIKTNSIDDSNFSSYKIIVYVDSEESYMCEVGDEVTFNGVIEEFTSGNDFDAESYYLSKGYSGIVFDPTNFLCEKESEVPFHVKITEIRNTVCNYIINLSDERTGGLLSALIMGERNYLPLGTKVDFSRIGISHVLALSGMHLAILVIGLSKLLAFLGVGKKTRTVISIIFTLLYMTLTGFSVSVTRAGLMLICSSLLYLLSRTKDSMTSLFIAVSLIVIFTPYSIYDTSLWLSAFATLGIIVFSELQNGRIIICRFVNWILSSILSTFFALGSTFIFTSLKFDGISLLSPLSTFVFSILIEGFIYLGVIMMLIGGFVPIQNLFIPFGNFILNFAHSLSEIDFIYGTTSHFVVKAIAVIFTILFFAFLVMKIKHKKTFLAFLIALLTSAFIFSAYITNTYETKSTITYSNTNSEKIIITDSGEVSVLDVSYHSSATPYDAYSALIKLGLCEIDKYIFLNYSYKLTDALETLLNTVLVKEIYLPTPTSYTEEKIYYKALSLINETHTEVVRYLNEDIIRVGETSVVPIYGYTLGSTEKILFTILHKDEFYTYSTANMLTSEIKNIASEVIGGSHTVIFGCHDSRSGEIKFNEKIPRTQRFIFSSNKIKFSQKAAEYYLNKNSYFKPQWIEIIR